MVVFNMFFCPIISRKMIILYLSGKGMTESVYYLLKLPLCDSNFSQVIRNVTRHRNGQSVKSRQTRWEWQLLISIMHIHDVVTRYNNCPFLCAWHRPIISRKMITLYLSGKGMTESVYYLLLPLCDSNFS